MITISVSQQLIGWRGSRTSQTFIRSVATHHQRGRKRHLLDFDCTEEEISCFSDECLHKIYEMKLKYLSF